MDTHESAIQNNGKDTSTFYAISGTPTPVGPLSAFLQHMGSNHPQCFFHFSLQYSYFIIVLSHIY
jgi:hypothetical protein